MIMTDYLQSMSCCSKEHRYVQKCCTLQLITYLFTHLMSAPKSGWTTGGPHNAVLLIIQNSIP